MRYRWSCLFVALFLVGCDTSDSSSVTPDTAADVSLSEDVASVEDVAAASGPQALLALPDDGRLYAAAGALSITPDEENHPCPDYLGGTGMNRLSEGLHSELETRVLLLGQGDTHVVLASLDLVGWEAPDTERVLALLAPEGIETRHVLLSSTHTHNGPDTIGVWGPEDLVTGRCPAYNAWLAERVAGLVVDLSDELVPVTLQAAEDAVDMPASNFANLVNDWRLPRVNNDHFTVARLAADDDRTVATIVNWHTHPEAMIHEDVVTADFPHWTRAAVEDALGGTCLYFSGTVGGLQTCMSVDVPARAEDGTPVLEDGEPVWVEEDGADLERSMGWFVADFALATLATAPVIEGGLEVDVSRLELPFENLMMIVGVQSGVIEPYEGIIAGDEARCGVFGCMPWELHHIRYGTLHLIDLPGELFPESSVGRAASQHDFSEEGDGSYGVWDFPAIEGYRAALPEGHLLLELGLTNQELGYLVPATDFLPSDHPGYYEEYFCVSKRAEAIIREGVREVLRD